MAQMKTRRAMRVKRTSMPGQPGLPLPVKG
jgi:hypothetical protein